MKTEYLSDLENDSRLFGAIELALPGLGSLTDEQIEKLVFYLKSLHSYYPESENHVAFYDKFADRLKVLREGPEQVALQARASRLVVFAMVAGGVSVATFATGLAMVLGGAVLGGLALLAGSVGAFIWAHARFGVAALNAAKEQDRRYFLASIRAARGCNELDWAGLFSYNSNGTGGDEKEAWRRVSALSRQLRDALYNDEFRQYTAAQR